MKKIVYNRDYRVFRYAAGTPVYSEQMEAGTLLSAGFRGHGIPLAEECKNRSFEDCPVFALEIDGCDARYGWEFKNFTEDMAPDGRERAELTLVSEKKNLQLRLVTYCGDNGILTRQCYLKNLTDRAMVLSKVSPLCGVLWEDRDTVNEYIKGFEDTPFSVGGFAGRRWGMEGIFEWNEIPLNRTLSFGSHNGKSGHGHPFAILKNKLFGGYFLCQMEWSTDWCFTFGAEYYQPAGASAAIRLTYALSPAPEAPLRILDPGEELPFPAVHFGLLYENFDRCIQALQTYQRKYILAQPYGGKELTSYDGWGFHGSDYREDILRKEIDRAAELGMELYMVDAGWYGIPGTNWYDTVGDWQTSRLPRDLMPLIEYVHKKGMKFGLWVEPESAGKQSLVARAHPDWFASYHGVMQERWLDLSNPEVEDWVYTQLHDIVSRYRLDLLRLDFNNPVVRGTRKHGPYEENILWRYTEALYRIFDRIHREFPNLLLENCASGGGRTDLGMMRRFSKTQFSDWYRLPRGARSFNGMSLCLPPECLLLQYGAALDNNNTGSAEMQIQMMMLGVPKISGISPIQETVVPALWEMLSNYLKIYKNFIRPMQRTALVFHHTPEIKGTAGIGWMAVEFASPQQDKAYIFVARLPGTEEDSFCLKPRGLKQNATYQVTFCSAGETVTLSGRELRQNGLEILRETPLTSELLLIERC